MKLERYVITRDLDLPYVKASKGEIVYAFPYYTYGCISEEGIAVSELPTEHPFFEVPHDAVEVVDYYECA